MGLSLSAHKRVQSALQKSPEFNSACDAEYAHCLSLSQHAFAGVKSYQLFPAAERLHSALLVSGIHLVSKWAHLPPGREQVDRALRTVLSRRRGGREVREEEVVLDCDEFVEFAVEVFVDTIVTNAGKDVLMRIPLGSAGIAVAGMVVKPGKKVVAAAIGVYALSVVTSVYLGLAG